MKLFLLALLWLIPVSLLLAQTSDTCPTTNGAYLKVDNEWKSIDSVHAIGFKTTGVAKMAFSYGAAAAKVKAQFRDPKSPYQITAPSFFMCLVGLIDSGRDITLAKFQEEKDHRELQMASIKTFSGVNAQIDPKSVILLDVNKIADKSYMVSAKQGLPPGEFILFLIVPDIQGLAKSNTPQALGGYDFGNHSK